MMFPCWQLVCEIVRWPALIYSMLTLSHCIALFIKTIPRDTESNSIQKSIVSEQFLSATKLMILSKDEIGFSWQDLFFMKKNYWLVLILLPRLILHQLISVSISFAVVFFVFCFWFFFTKESYQANCDLLILAITLALSDHWDGVNKCPHFVNCSGIPIFSKKVMSLSQKAPWATSLGFFGRSHHHCCLQS